MPYTSYHEYAMSESGIDCETVTRTPYQRQRQRQRHVTNQCVVSDTIDDNTKKNNGVIIDTEK